LSVIDRKEITIPEAHKILMDKTDELDPLQRRVLEYTIKFSKLESDAARELTEELVSLGLERGVAVQIVNVMPETIAEIRAFLGRQRIIAEEDLKKILSIIDKYRGG